MSGIAKTTLPPDEFRLQILECDIAAGTRGDCHNCAVAKAIYREYPDVFVEAASREILVQLDGKQKNYTPNPSLATWIDNYDNNREMRPFTTVLHVKEKSCRLG